MRPLSTALWLTALILPCAAPAGVPADVEAPDSVPAAAMDAADWRAIAVQTRRAALDADRADRPETLVLVQAARWARLMAQTEPEACRDWVAALRNAGAGSRSTLGDYRLRNRSLAEVVPSELAAGIFADPVRTSAFFAALDPTDNVVRVLEILAAISAAEPTGFENDFELALAVAVVFDATPRADWPHAQVGVSQLSRAWPDPVAAFRHWVAEDRAGRLIYPLRTLSVAQLCHVVDVSVSLEELRWAQAFCPATLSTDDVNRLLVRVPYLPDRVARGEFSWPWPDYRLPTLLATGGICADQAFFAVQVLKSRGVPAMLLSGSGREGRHAWIGYQSDANGRWRLDCGKDSNASVFNTVAIDPHTWREIDEWEMLRWGSPLVSEARHRQASGQAELARLWRLEGDGNLALRAARRAAGIEPLEEVWWQFLIETHAAVAAQNPGERESIVREAIAVAWPDPAVEGRFVGQLAGMIEARGDLLAAAGEWDRFLRRLERRRVDQMLDGSRERIVAELAQGRIASAQPMARRIVSERGREAGVALLDRFLFPVVRQMRATGHSEAAETLVTQTRAQLGSRIPAVARELDRADAARAGTLQITEVR